MKKISQIALPRIVALAAIATFALPATASPLAQHPERYDRFLFGVAYYPELCPESYWERDAERMKAAGVNVARIGEFAWSIMEPEEGRFDFSLFDRAIETLARHDVKVIFGTPTATPPKWLTHKYPETLHVFESHEVANDQSRRYTCYNSPVMKRLSHRVVEEIAKHYANNPNIVGWQIDNEMNNENFACYSDSCRRAFREWVRAKYSTLDALNDRWGTRFWSQRYTDWEQIDLPFRTPSLHNPALVLDFRRFTSDSASAFKSDQVETLHRYRPNDWITTNGIFRNVDYYRFSKDLDLHSYSNYPTFMTDPQYPTGSRMTLLRGITGRMMIMEQLTGPAGQTYLLRTPQPGQMNLWAMQTVAHGAEGVVHFNWRTARRGVEEYWFGVLDDDNVPRARYREFQKEGRELATLGPKILGSTIESDIAVIHDFEDGWVFEHQFFVDGAGYGESFDALFQAASEQKLNIDFVPKTADLSRYKLVFAPQMILVDPQTVASLARFVEGGGILVMSAHSAVKDRDNALTGKTLPVDMTDLFGVEVDQFQTYGAPSADKNAVVFTDGAKAPIRVWADVLKPSTARVAATWESDFFKGAPSCTENTKGKGLAVYFGSFLQRDSARELVRRYAKLAKVEPIIAGVPPAVEVTRRTKGSTNYYFILNHEGSAVEVAPGAGYTDALTGQAAPARFRLGAYEYRVLVR
jgi:beta-galactosidase